MRTVACHCGMPQIALKATANHQLQHVPVIWHKPGQQCHQLPPVVPLSRHSAHNALLRKVEFALSFEASQPHA